MSGRHQFLRCLGCDARASVGGPVFLGTKFPFKRILGRFQSEVAFLGRPTQLVHHSTTYALYPSPRFDYSPIYWLPIPKFSYTSQFSNLKFLFPLSAHRFPHTARFWRRLGSVDYVLYVRQRTAHIQINIAPNSSCRIILVPYGDLGREQEVSCPLCLLFCGG